MFACIAHILSRNVNACKDAMRCLSNPLPEAVLPFGNNGKNKRNNSSTKLETIAKGATFIFR